MTNKSKLRKSQLPKSAKNRNQKYERNQKDKGLGIFDIVIAAIIIIPFIPP